MKHIASFVFVFVFVLGAAVAPCVAQTVPGFKPPPGTQVESGGWIRLTARYVLNPIGVQVNGWPQIAQLLTADRVYIRSLQPVVSEYKYVDRRVEVHGRPFGYLREGASLPSTHYFEIRKIKLLPGETPREVSFGGMPGAQVLKSAQDVQGHDGRWGSLHGVLDQVEINSNEGISTGTLILDDGQSIELVNIVSTDPRMLWYSLLGERVTVVALMGRRSNPSAPVFAERADAVCEGYVLRCGLHPGQRQGGLRRITPLKGGQTGRRQRIELPAFLNPRPAKAGPKRPTVPRTLSR
jgi:hypothetical protein